MFEYYLIWSMQSHWYIAWFLSFSTDTSIDDIPAFRFDKILPANKTKYFRYSGSLTTPSCKESVTWTVFRDAVNISKYQVHCHCVVSQKPVRYINNLVSFGENSECLVSRLLFSNFDNFLFFILFCFSQMNLLRQLRKTYTVTSVGNFRPVQPLYDRVIRASFQVAEMVNTTSTTASTNETATTTATISEQKGTSSISSTVVATTNAEESPPAPTVEFELESSAVRLTGGLVLSTLVAVFFVH